MCIACISQTLAPKPGKTDSEIVGVLEQHLAEWSAGDLIQAATVNRQIPHLCRRLIAILSTNPEQERTEANLDSTLEVSLLGFSVTDVADWVQPYSSAVRRTSPVVRREKGEGVVMFSVDRTVAALFERSRDATDSQPTG